MSQRGSASWLLPSEPRDQGGGHVHGPHLPPRPALPGLSRSRRPGCGFRGTRLPLAWAVCSGGPCARHLGPRTGRRRWRAERSGRCRLACSQEEESPCGEVTLRRDRSFSEHDLAQLRSEVTSGLQPPGGLERARPRADSVQSWTPSAQEPGGCCPPFPGHPPAGALCPCPVPAASEGTGSSHLQEGYLSPQAAIPHLSKLY